MRRARTVVLERYRREPLGLAQLLPRRLDYALGKRIGILRHGRARLLGLDGLGYGTRCCDFENIFQSVRRKAALDAIRRIERAEKQSEQVSDEE